MLFQKEVSDSFRNDIADAVDIVDFLTRVGPVRRLARRSTKRVECSEMPREPSRIRFADAPDAERIDEAVECDLAPLLDRREQVAHRSLAEPLPLREIEFVGLAALLQGEDVGGRLDETFLVEKFDLLVAEPLDIHGETRAEMLEPLDSLRRADETAGAAAHHVFFSLVVHLAHRRRAAGGTGVRELVGVRAMRPLVEQDFHHLRDHVARALDHDGVADANILARNLVLVVQRRVLHDDAANGDRIEPRDRRERAGAANLDVDRAQHRRRALRRKFVRDSPSRRARDEAEALLIREIVDLVDDAVDIVAERRALLFDVAIMRDHLIGGMTKLRQFVGDETRVMQEVEHAFLRIRRHVRHFAPGIGEEAQQPLRRHAGVDLAQRTRRRIARIGVDHLSRLRLPFVQLGEIGAVHVDFAARFQDGGRFALQFVRNFGNRAHIGRHILALEPVAARRGLHEFAALVAQRAGEPVDLRLCGEGERRVFLQAEEAAHARNEFVHFLVGKNVAERQHRHGVFRLRELLGRRGADLLGQRIRRMQFGKSRLQRLVPPPQRVVIGVGNRGRVVLVVAPVVFGDLGAEQRMLRARHFRGKLVDRLEFHAADVARRTMAGKRMEREPSGSQGCRGNASRKARGPSTPPLPAAAPLQPAPPP